MKPYESYNDWNEEWFGSIPQTWGAQRIKTLFDLHDERNYLPLSEVNLISLYSSIGVRQHSDIEHTTGNKARNADGYKVVNKGDIIVNILLCWMGAIGRSDYNGVTSPAYDVYTPKNGTNSYYYHYLFRIPLFSQQCYKVGKGIMSMRWRTYSPQFRNIIVPVPSASEQKQIVRFLDWKVSGINRLIDLRHTQITLLREMKQQIIDKAVIRGLRKTEFLHNADIRWDIDFPSHWNLQRIRQSFTFKKGLSITKTDLEETGISVINYGQVHSKKNTGVGLNDELIKFVNEKYLYLASDSVVEKGDFIFADTSEDISGCGNCAYNDREGIILAGYHTIIAHPNDKTRSKYFAYLFKSAIWRYQIRKKVNGVKVYSITQQILKDAFVLIPPVEEQEEIVLYLDNLCSKIDALIKKTEEKLQQYEELKISLIADVVTGKLDVRRIKIPEYEFVSEDSDVYPDLDDDKIIIEEQEA